MYLSINAHLKSSFKYIGSMITLLKVILESIRQAFSSLIGNKLRSFLSLVGITIGIFCIISVKSAVDSLQNNVMEGISEIGTGVVYVEKYPWNEDWEDNYFKYMKRPDPDLEDYELIKEKSKLADQASYSIFQGDKTIKYKSSSVSNITVMGSSFEFQDIQSLDIEKGRYFTLSEYNSGANKIILGSIAAKELFGNLDPIGKEVKLFGQSYLVLGVLKEEGESMFNFMNFDDVIWVSLTNARRYMNIKDGRGVGESLMVRARQGVSNEDLKSELTGLLRAHRKLRPRDKDNFSLMEMSSLNQVLDGFFGTLNIAGFVIGGFALIVGMFSVANIMFVSVKERTNIIGIKKALGAQKFIILLEFLIEAIVLCLIGGFIGLLVSYGMITLISQLMDFQMIMTFNNAMAGIIVSVLVGIISGIIPAYLASKLDPVVAIRQ